MFSGGFLGLDNIGAFDRSQVLPNGATLRQADGTAWMAFYRITMLEMALELASAIPSRRRLERVLSYMLDEKEFLSPYGIRSLSKFYKKDSCIFNTDGVEHRVDFDPGESSTHLFGGNSNWRGPIWFPVNYLLIEALERYHHFYGDTFQIQCPTGSGRIMNLQQVANELGARLASIFLPDATGRRPCHGDDARFASDPHWRDLVLFHEYFHGETGRGLGANHQTGWTALVIRYIADLARQRGGTV